MKTQMSQATRVGRRQAGRPTRSVDVLQCWEDQRYTDSMQVEVSSRSDLTVLTALLGGRGLAPVRVVESFEGFRPTATVSVGPAQVVLRALEDAGWCVTWRRDLWMMPGHLVTPGVRLLDYIAPGPSPQATR